MATSGTQSWSLDIDEIIREAIELAGGQQALGNDAQTLIRSFNLLQTELTNRKINLFTLTPRTLAIAQGTAEYDIPTTDVDILNGAIRQGTGTSQSDVRIERIGFDQFAAITNKNVQGRPTLFYVQRGVQRPVVTFWPTPDQTYTFYYWVFQRIEDANKLSQDPALPFRFQPVLTNGLAYYLARKRAAQVDNPDMQARMEAMVARLKGEYEEQLKYATSEDRERISTFVVPNLNTP